MKKNTTHYFFQKSFISLLIILFSCPLVYAGKIDRGYKALNEYDYFKAKKLFEKRQNKDIVASSYGLSIIYGRTDNPFSNLDSAYKFIYRAVEQYPQMKKGKREKLRQLNVDSLMIQEWKSHIDYERYK